jgi:hypothetical protein
MGQGIKDWAIRGLVASTLGDNGAQRALETFQFFNFLLDVSYVALGDALPSAQALRRRASRRSTRTSSRETNSRARRTNNKRWGLMPYSDTVHGRRTYVDNDFYSDALGASTRAKTRPSSIRRDPLQRAVSRLRDSSVGSTAARPKRGKHPYSLGKDRSLCLV